MTAIKVGLIPSPGLPKKLMDNIIDDLSELAAENISSDWWTFEMEVSVLTSSSEYINETVHNMVAIKNGMIGILSWLSAICQLISPAGCHFRI